jgi:hypothetical protein
MVEFAESDAPSDGNLHGERGTMSAGRDKTAEPAEPMLKLHKDLPKAKPPLGPPAADGLRAPAANMRFVMRRH